MQYEIAEKVITFEIENPKREAGVKSIFSREGTALTDDDLTKLCSVTIKICQGKKTGTQRNFVFHFFRPVLEYSKVTGGALPVTSDGWQLFLLGFFQNYLTSSAYTNSSSETRRSNWASSAQPVLELCQDEGILPCDVFVPSFNDRHVLSSSASGQFVGDKNPVATPVAIAPQKLLVSIDFAKDGSDYLESIERECRERIDVLKKVCIAHWDALTKDGLTGARLASKIDAQEISGVIESGKFAERIRAGNLTPLASITHPRGHLWALSVGKKLLGVGTHQDCISRQTLQESKFFGKEAFLGPSFKTFAEETAMPPFAFNQMSAFTIFCRFAGVLSSLDGAAACCILTIEHPEFTPDALISARLLNPRGKTHLLLTDSFNSSILSLDKPRAGTRKSAALSPVAQRLIKNIVAWTAPVREVLKRAGDKCWRFLFLGYNARGRLGRLGCLNIKARHLVSGTCLTRFYPILTDHGLTQGTLDFSRIRVTMGVLRWFETGSIREMSRRLGNTQRVVLEYYLPPALLHAWNTRIIRRFQNTLIVLAAQGEDYLLEVTDFTTLSDLQHFIAQLVVEYPKRTSPLAKEVQTRLASTHTRVESESACSYGESLLNIRLSATSLGYLYAYSDCATNTLTPSELDRIDSKTKLAPAQFIALTRLIRHACENDVTNRALRELIDIRRLRELHQSATCHQTKIMAKLANLSIKRQW